MPIESSDSGTLITGDSIALFRHLQIIHGLALEINTGMKLSSRGSVMLVAKAMCGSPKRTKRGVLSDFVAFTRSAYPSYESSPNVVKALTK